VSSTKFIYTTNFDEVDMQDTLPGASTVIHNHITTHTQTCVTGILNCLSLVVNLNMLLTLL